MPEGKQIKENKRGDNNNNRVHVLEAACLIDVGGRVHPSTLSYRLLVYGKNPIYVG